MGIEKKIAPNGEETTIVVGNRFDYSLHSEFRTLYRDIDANKMRFVVDLANTDYIDSSALGMLLLLREAAGGDNAKIKIVNCKPEVKSILRISNFQNLFTLQ